MTLYIVIGVVVWIVGTCVTAWVFARMDPKVLDAGAIDVACMLTCACLWPVVVPMLLVGFAVAIPLVWIANHGARTAKQRKGE